MQLNEVKQAILDKTVVEYDEGKYLITACILRRIKGEWYYQLELSDIKTNGRSVVIVDMRNVKLE